MPPQQEVQVVMPPGGQSSPTRKRWVNSLGFSCYQEDYPGKSFRPRHALQIHMPKAAGTSVEKWGRTAGYHFVHEHLMPHMRRHDPPDAFRFSFVRNPYTRFISQYTFCKQGPFATWNRGFPCHVVLPQHGNMSFDDWWMRLWTNIVQVGNGSLPSMHLDPSRRPHYQSGHFNGQGIPCTKSMGERRGCRNTPSFWCSGIWWGNCFGPVSQWVYRDGVSGARAVDWVGKLENITSDFACLRNLLNRSSRAPATLEWTRGSFENTTTRKRKKSVREWLTNETLVHLIRTHYKDDFVNFGYSMELPGSTEYTPTGG